MKFALSSMLLCAAPVLACGPFFPNTVLDRPNEMLRAPTFAFDLTGVLPRTSLWHAVTNNVVIDNKYAAEDRDYELGATAWHAGNTNEARTAWQQLLARPPGERQRRSTSAAYMLGKSYLGNDDNRAIAWFRLTRDLVGRGFADPAGLAASSIGWEARAELSCDELIRAGDLYVQHFATGDPTALLSLRLVAGKLLAADADTLRATAQHPALNRVVTVYLAARGGPLHPAPPSEQTRAWLAAVETVGTMDLVCADRLAWAAYQTGDFDGAKRWMARAPRQLASTGWLRAKLLLRDGKSDEAAEALAQTVSQFPKCDDWPDATKYRGNESGQPEPSTSFDQARGELAMLQLSRREYRDTLNLLVQTGYWTDAAYVAERVLTVDELLDYVRHNTEDHASDANLHHLLARRLARLGRYADASPYMPEKLRPKLDELAAAIAKHDAASLWQAAQIMRKNGIELTGSELEPDWYIHEGRYNWGFDSSNRLESATTDERERITRHVQEVFPHVRFHYRYRATELAWEAAALMPDNSDETAGVLYEAGSWLKDRDPQTADQFYKALVKRCGKTELGKAADRNRWF